MAEAASDKGAKESGNDIAKDKGCGEMECAVCLQPCVHPAQLPCGHIFCFLCVKGIANQSKRCAMCRQEIPRDFIDQPHLLEKTCTADTTESFDGGYQWFYEGRNGWWQYDPRMNEDIEVMYKTDVPAYELLICGELYVIDFQNNFQYPKRHPHKKRSIKREKKENLLVKGWWQYDERTSKELENFYKTGDRTCELLIAGFLYIIDLENMIQLRRNDPSRRRRIKRDFASVPKKGIAGLRTGEILSAPEVNVLEERPLSPTEGRTDNITPLTPSNTPQSPTSGRESPHQEHDLQATVERISSLQLNADATYNFVRAARNNNSNPTENANRCRSYRHRSVD